MTKLNLKLEGADKLIKELGKLGDEARKRTDSVTDSAVRSIASDAISNVRKDTGTLASRITPIKVEESSYAVVVYADYAAYVEFGTGKKVRVPSELKGLASKIRNQKTGTFEEGLDNIREWCRRIGIEESAAYPIFMSILQNGLEPRPFLFPAYIKNKSKYIKDLKKLLNRLTKK